MSSEARRQQLMDLIDKVLVRHHLGEDVVPMSVSEESADAVIAHLYERADDPATVEAVAKGIHAEVWKGDEYLMPWDRCRQERYLEDARGAIPLLLTALIGPRPQGESDER